MIFVSRDREEEALVEYYKEHMGEWAYIEFGNDKIQWVIMIVIGDPVSDYDSDRYSRSWWCTGSET